jgi:ribonuclease BN (tRNA processing enzyme)
MRHDVFFELDAPPTDDGLDNSEDLIDEGGRHGFDAAEIAKLAGVQRLALVHAREDKQAEAVAAARTIFPNTFWPEDGQVLMIED